MKQRFYSLALSALMIMSVCSIIAQQSEQTNPFYNTLLNRIEVPGSHNQWPYNPTQPPAILETGTDEVVVTVLVNQYVFPYHMSNNGQHIIISAFGGGSAYWSQATGLISFPGTAYGVSENALVGGYFNNPNLLYNGNPVQTAGFWTLATQQWTFLGMHPQATVFSSDYSSGWGISGDGITVVGMQYMSSYTNYKAFTWTQQGGYDLIGNTHTQGSRASGISTNGSIVYGWAQSGGLSRSPVIWHNGQMIFIDNTQGGEGFGASANGQFATGTLGGLGFLWSPNAPLVTFPNSINSGAMSPTCVTNDGTIFGFNNTAWPPIPTGRRAFARDNQGNMTTFNTYAESRGLPNAQAWTFYSINHVTPDGNKFIGAGITPQGQTISFLMEFPPLVTVIPGDANCDGNVNVLDIITFANYILGLNPEPFCFDNADVNEDGIVNLIDLIGTVNIIIAK